MSIAVDENEDGSITFNCPVCNAKLFDFENPDEVCACKHVKLYYTDALNDEFVHVGNGMEEVADNIIAKYVEDFDEGIEVHMEKLVKKNKNYEIFTVTTSGMACGPCSNTDYILIDLTDMPKKKEKKEKEPKDDKVYIKRVKEMEKAISNYVRECRKMGMDDKRISNYIIYASNVIINKE